VKILPLTPDDPMPDLEERLAALRALGPMEFDPGEWELTVGSSIFADQRREKAMNKFNLVFLAAGLIVGLLVGGLTAALWYARYNAIDYHYASDCIMRQSNQLFDYQKENKELQKRIQELEQQKNRS
jgi:hypothetical protein